VDGLFGPSEWEESIFKLKAGLFIQIQDPTEQLLFSHHTQIV